MGQRNVSWFVILLVFVLYLISFGLALGAARSRVKARAEDDGCVYDFDVATGLGIGAALFLLSSQAYVSSATRCLCCGSASRPGAARVFAVIFFILSWGAVAIAEMCLIVGSVKHYRFRGYFGGNHRNCSSLRKGAYEAGATFIVISFVFSVLCYICHSKARDSYGRGFKETDRGARMSQYS